MSLKSKLRSVLKIDPRLMRKMRKLLAPFRRIGIKKKFTVFANNCWGGRLYDKFGLPYLTPTIGLAMNAQDFVEFLKNIDYYLSLTPIPIETKQKTVNDEWGYYDCTLGNIIVEFRHYRNVEDAISKWTRRKTRTIYDNIIVKMSYYIDNPDYHLLDEFCSLPYKKILFVDNKGLEEKYKSQCRVVYIPKNQTDSEFVASDSKLKLKELKKIINS